MRNLFLVVLLATASLISTAQSKFNGTVTFSVDYKGDMVEMLRSMMPNKQVYSYLDGSFRMQTMGGMANGQGDVLYLAKEDKTYIVNTAAKKAQEVSSAQVKEEEKNATKDVDVTVTKTDETDVILGYTCQKYKVVIKNKDGELLQYIWATTALNPVKPKNTEKLGALTAITDGVDGMPLKVQMEIEQMGMSFSMIMTATKIDEGTPDKALFVIPADYTVEAFDPNNLRKR